MTETSLIDGKIVLRPDSKGEFDELVMRDESGLCLVHAEMMAGNVLWIGLYPPGEAERRVVLWVSASGELKIKAWDEPA